VAEPIEQPLGVVGINEPGDGLAQLIDGVAQLRPQALLLEGADPALGAAVGQPDPSHRMLVIKAISTWSSTTWADGTEKVSSASGIMTA
jgi:hypothetical protein